MQILPPSLSFTSNGLRPRLACELRPQGIVAARSADASGVLAQVAAAPLAAGIFAPSLHTGNIADRSAFISALQLALDPLTTRDRDITLVIPDSAVRVLLLDFDTLPSRLSEALPVVRFRLKKLLPFEADDAGISYQIMSNSGGMVRVMAAAMPREVLDEYELAVRDAGFEPGAILPSTLASLTLLPPRDANALIVNANSYSVTTAIVNAGILLLHRTLDFTVEVPTLAEVRAEENAPTPEPVAPRAPLTETEIAADIAQTVSIGAAYFEDTLNVPPSQILCSGTVDAAELTAMLATAGFEGIPAARDIVPSSLLLADAATAAVPRSHLAGVAGALATGEAAA